MRMSGHARRLGFATGSGGMVVQTTIAATSPGDSAFLRGGDSIIQAASPSDLAALIGGQALAATLAATSPGDSASLLGGQSLAATLAATSPASTANVVGDDSFDATSVTGCRLWARASKLGLTNGAAVSSWSDLTGGSHPYTQATGANQPTYVASSSNGKPAVRFAGAANLSSGQFMATVTTLTLNQPFTIWLVVKQISWIINGVLIEGAQSAEDGQISQNAAGSSPSIRLYAGAFGAANGDLAIGSYGLVQAIIDGASSSLRVGTHTATTGNAGSVGSLGSRIGGTAGGLFSSNVEISEIIYYDGHQGSSDRTKVLNGLTALYGAGV
jgi:hypothetical protein